MAKVTITAKDEDNDFTGRHPVNGVVFDKGEAKLDVDVKSHVDRARVLYFERHDEGYEVKGPSGGWKLEGTTTVAAEAEEG